MRVFLIDTSGSFPIGEINRLHRLLRVGDSVVMFDHKSYDMGVMKDRQSIDRLPLMGGGGTLLAQALEFVHKTYPDLPVTIYTDGCIVDREESKEVLKRLGMVVEEIIPYTNVTETSMVTLMDALTESLMEC